MRIAASGSVRRTPASAWVQLWVHFGSNWRAQTKEKDEDKSCNYNGLGLGDYSPEKAGVGGSIPSLATMFSIACGDNNSRFDNN